MRSGGCHTVQLKCQGMFLTGAMAQYLRYLLTPIILVTLLWSSTFLHDFCEDVLAASATLESHDHIAQPEHSFHSHSAGVEQSIGSAEEHSHQPSLFSNHRSNRLSLSLDSGQSEPIMAPMLPKSWQAGLPVTIHSQQRPPPLSPSAYKLPTYLRYQVLLI